jgi:hypothetical protein
MEGGLSDTSLKGDHPTTIPASSVVFREDLNVKVYDVRNPDIGCHVIVKAGWAKKNGGHLTPVSLNPNPKY